MTKNQIITLAITSIMVVFILSIGFVLISRLKKVTKATYKLTSTITRNYNLPHPKTFPAPYERVNGLP